MAEQHGHELIPDDVKRSLRDTFFSRLTDPVTIEVFTLAGMNDQYNEATISLITTLVSLSDKLSAKFYTVGDAQSVKHGVTRSPSVLISPDRYRIRFTGSPVGEEGKSLLLGIMMASTGTTTLSEPSVKRLAELREKRHVQVFVSPTCPYCPQQALTAFAAAIARPEFVSAEAVEIYENQDLADRLGSLTVPQTYINDMFTGAGLQSELGFIESLMTLQEPRLSTTPITGEPQTKDLVIIGGGPAGLTAAIYATRAGLSCVVIEKAMLGGQIAITPIVENYPGFMRIGGKSLVDLIAQQAAQYAEIHQGEYIVEARRDSQTGAFQLTTNHARYTASAVIVATGVDNRALEAPGARTFYGRGVSYCATCDGYFFKDGKTVIVVGGGNTAVTDALYLHNLGAKVTLVHRRGELRAEARLQDSLAQSGIPVLWNSEVREVTGERVVRSVKIENLLTRQVAEQAVDGIFVAIGYIPNTDAAKQLGLELDAAGYVKTDLATMRTSLPNAYAAGDITGGLKQIVVAVAQGSLAATSAFEDLAALTGKKQQTTAS